MTDVLFLAHGRPEFTKASWAALQKNTPNTNLWVFTDGDESQELTGCEVIEPFGGPVACMNAFLDISLNSSRSPAGDLVAKIDNDVIVPPGWLQACEDIMRRHPEVDLLGIEPWTPDTALFPKFVHPSFGPFTGYEARRVSHVGGIGVFRRSVFERFGRPTPNSQDGRYGFTEFQWAHKDMVKVFIDPPLPVFLLDHLPSPYWMWLSKKYEDAQVQRRQWGFYHPVLHSSLWDWWSPPAYAEGHAIDGWRSPAVNCERILKRIAVTLMSEDIGIHREAGRVRVITRDYVHAPTVHVFAWADSIDEALENFADGLVD